MDLIIKKRIGRNTYTFVFTGENLYQAVMASQSLSFGDIDKCGCCQSDDLVLSAHLGKDDKGKEVFEYTEVKCQACRASLTFGQKKDKVTFYFRRKDGGDLDWKPFDSPSQRGLGGGDNESPKLNGTKVNTNASAQSGKSQAKLSMTALKYAEEIIKCEDMKTFEGLGAQIAINKQLTDNDKNYLRVEYRKRFQILQPDTI